VRLDLSTWLEVEAYLKRSKAIVIPTGSTEQHGPMGLIGTDALCAQSIARIAGKKAGTLVVPTLAYTPAPFNLGFPGTMSVSSATFQLLVTELVEGLLSQGFRRFYFLNGHGANLAPLNAVALNFASDSSVGFRIRSWWDFDAVNRLRAELYGDWEGMHATPSEVAITQATYRVVEPGTAEHPPAKLSREFIKEHAGDRHGSPDEHRRDFPDGRVGSHSALARPEHGELILKLASEAMADDIRSWAGAREPFS